MDLRAERGPGVAPAAPPWHPPPRTTYPPRPPPARRIASPTTACACTRKTDRVGINRKVLLLSTSATTSTRPRLPSSGRRTGRCGSCMVISACGTARTKRLPILRHACLPSMRRSPCAPQYCSFSMSRFYFMEPIHHGPICVLCRFDGGCQSLRLPRCWILVPSQAQCFGKHAMIYIC